jgi:hypothetical protein
MLTTAADAVYGFAKAEAMRDDAIVDTVVIDKSVHLIFKSGRVS